MNARYAVYFVPEPGTALASLGSTLLGRDSESGGEIRSCGLPGVFPERLRDLTAAARRYGLHATLKAPFFPGAGVRERDILASAARFVLGRRPVMLPRLELARLGSFFALVPAAKTPEEQEAARSIRTLAADAVSFFDPFRAAPSEREIARRNPQKLTERQRKLLAEWGYPYVFDEYRFHITLADSPHSPAEAGIMENALKTFLKPVLNAPVMLSDICLCRQEMQESRQPGSIRRTAMEPGVFTLWKRIPLESRRSIF